MLSTLILDLGNVLLFHDNALWFRRMAKGAGLGVDEVERRLAPLWTDINSGKYDAAGTQDAVQSALRFRWSRQDFVEMWSCHFTENETMFPLVEALSDKLRLVLLSNTNALHADYFLPRLKVLEHFDHLLLSHEVGRVKPDPELYREALRRAGAEPGQAAFFDDIREYVDAASRLGIHGRLYTNTEAFRRQLAELGVG